MTDAERFPLGKPINRKTEPDLTPQTGRPGWFRDRKNLEVFIDPGSKPIVGGPGTMPSDKR